MKGRHKLKYFYPDLQPIDVLKETALAGID